MAVIRLRRGIGYPTALLDGEPALDLTVDRPLLLAGVNGSPVVLADPVRLALLEARIRYLELALRELQYIAWTGHPTYPISARD